MALTNGERRELSDNHHQNGHLPSPQPSPPPDFGGDSPLSTEQGPGPAIATSNGVATSASFNTPERPGLTYHRNRSSSFPFRSVPPSPVLTESSSHRINAGGGHTEAKNVARREIAKLSPAQIYDLTSAPDSIPIRSLSPAQSSPSPLTESIPRNTSSERRAPSSAALIIDPSSRQGRPNSTKEVQSAVSPRRPDAFTESPKLRAISENDAQGGEGRPRLPSRSMSIPFADQKSKHGAQPLRDALRTANLKKRRGSTQDSNNTPKPTLAPPNATLLDPPPSPMPSAIPIPPFSMPTYLQLELSSDRPSPLYIHSPSWRGQPYESSYVKYQRLLNFLRLPPELEQTLFFGALTCLDAWLYTFTILPLRFSKAVWMLASWMARSAAVESRQLAHFVYEGIGRLWHRHRQKKNLAGWSPAGPSRSGSIQSTLDGDTPVRENGRPDPKTFEKARILGHRRAKSRPSNLQSNHKADILQGLLILVSCMVLTKFDASRMYHNIRGQAAIKLYVIYNVLEVSDRLLSALGQDILECLFSQETLERNENGRSKLLRPFWMFLLALVYCVIHSTALFYQVITLNVAVNSYSNALLTLLMSNQFVEIKTTVFKKFEKENLFQLTCADVVERFQLWHMLLIIGLRNIVEVGGLSISLSSSPLAGPSSSTTTGTANDPSSPNATAAVHSSSPLRNIPHAFTFMPTLLPFQVLAPFLIVLGSEMLVDWLKHAYITKFNATSPHIYARFLDILSKDYYTHAFQAQNLTRRLGLPVIPLACLFIRAALQTYHMFLATNITTSPPVLSTATSLSVEPEAQPTASPVLVQIEQIFRRALGQSSFGAGSATGGSNGSGSSWWFSSSRWSLFSLDDMIALATMLFFFLALYLILLAFKLALGMVLLRWARGRYKGMKGRENEKVVEAGSKRLGGWGTVEVGEERRKWIYEDDPVGLRNLREREAKGREKDGVTETADGKAAPAIGSASAGGAAVTKTLEGVDRYSMVAKRIW
ncbi:MAG: hypothetical protein M1831_000972 [Alyxoria varia]|nr:MAG: hypothetical protein M1831_000972 [Alyxoria varia]